MGVFKVVESITPLRLDVFLTKEAKYSRAKIQTLIKAGLVFVNSKKILKSSTRLKIGDTIFIHEEEHVKEKDFLPAPDLPLTIKFENKNVVVIEKPAGILSHPTAHERTGTVVNWILAKYPEIARVGEHSSRPGLVHRLDRNTSGLMVIAKTQASFFNLKSQFQERTIHKKYFALVVGVPKAESGSIDYPISVSLKGTVRRKADLKGKIGTPALTHWKIVRTFGNEYALLEVEPKTGRTHQIRAHLAAIHHPVMGDPLYGGTLALQLNLSRQFLHAYYLKFKDINRRIIEVTTELPPDLQVVITQLTTTNLIKD